MHYVQTERGMRLLSGKLDTRSLLCPTNMQVVRNRAYACFGTDDNFNCNMNYGGQLRLSVYALCTHKVYA